jgi:DNA polymerase III subunit alpha, Gram-positive type
MKKIDLKPRNSEKWKEQIGTLLEQKYCEELDNFCLGGLTYFPQRRSVSLEFLVRKLPSDFSCMEAVKEALEKFNADKIVFRIIYPENIISAQDYLEAHFKDIVEIIKEELNLDQEGLTSCGYSWDGDFGEQKLFWYLRDDWSRELLNRKKANLIFERIVKIGCGEKIEVVIVAVDKNILPDLESEVEIDNLVKTETVKAELISSREHSPEQPTSSNLIPLKKNEEKILKGRIFSDQNLVRMDSITSAVSAASVQGKVFNLEEFTLKSGQVKVTLSLTDGTGSVLAVWWGDRNSNKKHVFKKGMWLRVRGRIMLDHYNRDQLILEIQDCVQIPTPSGRTDKAERKRVELHAHTKMSAADAVTGIKEYIEQAIEWGHPAVGITDHGVVHSFPDAYKCAQTKIKLLLGMEGYLVEDFKKIKRDKDSKDSDSKNKKNKYYHIVIYAASEQGRKNLYKLVSSSHLNTFYNKPLIPRDELIKYREGLILGTACESGELFQAVLNGSKQDELESIVDFYDYLEVQPVENNEYLIRQKKVKDFEILKDVVRKIVRLGEKTGKPVVATTDLHYLNPEDEIYRRILQVGNKMSDGEQQPPLYFRTTEEMLKEFSWLGEEKAFEIVVTNTQKVADMCEQVRPVPKGSYFPELVGAEENVIGISTKKAKEIYGEPLPQLVEARLNKELNSIVKNQFSVLYEISRKLVEKSIEHGFSVGSRGSVGSSLVAFLLGITEVNPLPSHERCSKCGWVEFYEAHKESGVDIVQRPCPQCGAAVVKDGHNIPFETFVGFKGNKVPDIDLNFAPEIQGEIQKYAEQIFGEGRAFKAGTILTLKDKTAFGYVKKYFESKGENKSSVEVERLKEGLVGIKKTSGTHPGGVILVRHDKEITDFTPVQYSGDGNLKSDSKNKNLKEMVTTHFDFHSIDECLVKLDILGKEDASVFKYLQDLTNIHESAVPLDDRKALSVFASSEALGLPKLNREEQDFLGTTGALAIPEFGTDNTRRMLEITKPNKFTELIYISGLSHGTGVWQRNAEDLIKNKIADLATVISTRDDIMNTLITWGMDPSRAFDITEKVRKGKVSKEGFSDEEQKSLTKVNAPRWWIESCSKIEYMFPKAHAVAYCFTAVRMAWFKVYHPRAFYAAWFTSNAESVEADIAEKGKDFVLTKIRQMRQPNKENLESTQKKELSVMIVVYEAILRGIQFEAVDIYKSDSSRFIPGLKENSLLPPLVSIAGLGATVANAIARERVLRPFRSVEDLVKRTGMNKTVVEKLVNKGILDSMPMTDQITLF